MPIAPPTQSTPQQTTTSPGAGKPGKDLRPKPGMSYWQYFQYLLSQGVDAIHASEIMAADPNYGTPDQWNARQKNMADKARQANAWGQLTGTVGVGALVSALGSKSPKYAPSGRLTIQRQIPEQTLDLDQLPHQQTPTTTEASQYQTPATQTTSPGQYQTSATQPNIEGESYRLPDQQYSLDETTTIQTNAGPRTVPKSVANDEEFIKGTDWSQIGNSAFAALNAYQAYQAYKNKDYVGAGISGATAGLGAGAAYYGAGSQAAQALPYAGGVAGLYGGYQTAKMIGSTPKSKQRDVQATTGGAAAGAGIGAATGAMYGEGFGPIGMGIGAAIGAAAGFAGSKFGSHKGKGQALRDNIRAEMKDNGTLDKNYQGTLADGSKYDFGKDGKELKWSNVEKVADANRAAWDATGNAAGAIGLHYNLTGQKNSDVAAWMQMAAVSNAKNDPKVAMANIRHIVEQQGIDYTTIKNNLDTALADNKISQSQYDQYVSGMRDIYGNAIVGSDVKPRAGMSTKEKEARHKSNLAASGINLDKMKLTDIYNLYLNGSITKDEFTSRLPKPGAYV